MLPDRYIRNIFCFEFIYMLSAVVRSFPSNVNIMRVILSNSCSSDFYKFRLHGHTWLLKGNPSMHVRVFDYKVSNPR